MKDFLFLVIFCLVLAMPVAATNTDGGDLDGTVSSSDPAVSADNTDATESTLATEETQAGINALAVNDSFAGGYYFVCDCALGNDLKFYVPWDWANDVFTLNSSGAPVNMSNSTCYAYCPAYPNYTFTCSRFSTFTYRSSGSSYSTSDLNITDISDTNISFMMDESFHLSDSDLQALSCALIFLVAAILIIKKG